jgi:hypothetical protein
MFFFVLLVLVSADCPTSFSSTFSASDLARVDPICFADMRYELLLTLPLVACAGSLLFFFSFVFFFFLWLPSQRFISCVCA